VSSRKFETAIQFTWCCERALKRGRQLDIIIITVIIIIGTNIIINIIIVFAVFVAVGVVKRTPNSQQAC
jgi:hypothetical protein